jgi:transposase-like protein
MANLRTPVETISLAMKVRSEGLGLRATGRILGVAANSVINWEKHLSEARYCTPDRIVHQIAFRSRMDILLFVA